MESPVVRQRVSPRLRQIAIWMRRPWVLTSAKDRRDLSRLSPRLRRTLHCLQQGDSEKQVASRLGLSRPTVHQYVMALYRHFGVGSRAELLASFLRIPWPGVGAGGESG